MVGVTNNSHAAGEGNSESGKEGIFTKERDHLDEKAVKASVLRLPKDDTLSLARYKANEVEGGLGLVLNEYGLGIRVTGWHEKAAREKLHLKERHTTDDCRGVRCSLL